MELENIKTENQAKKALEDKTKSAIISINNDKEKNVQDAIKTYDESLKFIFGIAKKFHINVREYAKKIYKALPVMY